MKTEYTAVFGIFFALVYILSPTCLSLVIITILDIHLSTSFEKPKNESTPCTYNTISESKSASKKKGRMSCLSKIKSAKNKTFSRLISKISSLSFQHKLTFTKRKGQKAFAPKQELASHFYDIEMKAQSPRNDFLLMSSSYNFSSIDPSAAEYAQRIWDQDKTVYEDLSHIVEWIGNGKASSHDILKCYMAHFDFKGLELDLAFRLLCSKLHLKGETQQIDRILYEFAERYFECNPQCVFGTIDVVYSIVYSLLLLNTDLHVAQGDYKKMTRSEFVNNVMNAVYTQVGTPAYNEDEQVFDESRNASGLSLRRTPSDGSITSYTASVDSIPRNLSSWVLGSKTWNIKIRNSLKQMYTAIRNQQIANPSSTIAVRGSSSSNVTNNRINVALKRSIGTIMWKNNGGRYSIEEDLSPSSPISVTHCSSISSNRSIAPSSRHNELPAAITSSAPYYKEGLVSRKHLLEKSNQKAKHRDWRERYMVVDHSQLRMYKLETTPCPSSNPTSANNGRNHTSRLLHLASRSSSVSDSASRMSECSSIGSAAEAIGGNDWLARAQLTSTIDLKHCLANALPSGYNRQRQHAFALMQSNGAVHLFEVNSEEQVREWVSACNYWAARESKIPLSGGVSSMEYGWGPHLAKTNKSVTHIHEWQAPFPPMVSSQLEESAQYDSLSKYVRELGLELDAHRDLKPKMELCFSGSSKLGNRAMTNWENKSHYLLHEIIKYQNYCDSIEKSLVVQENYISSSS
ncbi:hypothetical protein BY458DRAFT_489900 [Sporodiniella umbellata]|nr:hypothetical protein BY458DRAFT_489900 [Sporodiniella umbellata]